MKRIAFDSDKYIKLQSAKIMERVTRFNNKLYLEFGGKLFDDNHASRVLPGFQPDIKIKMLSRLADKAEIIISINAHDIEKSKRRSDLDITYNQDVMRLIDAFTGIGHIEHHIMFILMELDRDRTLSGDGVHRVLEQVFNHPLQERCVKHDDAFDAVEAPIIDDDTTAGSRSHIGHRILHDGD